MSVYILISTNYNNNKQNLNLIIVQMRSNFFAVALSMFAMYASASTGPEAVVAAKVAAVKAKSDAAAAPAAGGANPMVSAISSAIKESFETHGKPALAATAPAVKLP